MLNWLRRRTHPDSGTQEVDPAVIHESIDRAQRVRLDAERAIREIERRPLDLGEIHRRAEKGPFPFLGDDRQGMR